jgi:hypothetical protein
LARTYVRKSDYKKIKGIVEDMVQENTVMLAEHVIDRLEMLGYIISVHRLAHIVRYSDRIIKLYERKKCEGAPTGHFVWLVDADKWSGFKCE